MKMALDDASGLYIVKAYEPGRVTLNTAESFSRSLVIFPNSLHKDWSVTDIKQLQPRDLKPVYDEKPEILILGTGETQVFPHPKTFITLIDLMIGYEVMDNAAAARTFNILMNEGRRAALALIFNENA